MGFIILVIARVGYKGEMVPASLNIKLNDDGSLALSPDGFILNSMVSYGLFLVVLIQLIAILLGEKTPITVR
jgi:hypothetical protein